MGEREDVSECRIAPHLEDKPDECQVAALVAAAREVKLAYDKMHSDPPSSFTHENESRFWGTVRDLAALVGEKP